MRTRSLALSLLAPALLSAAPGCSKILGIDDVTLQDGGTPPPDTAPPPNTVVGRSFTRHLGAGAPTDVPMDLSQETIQALIIDDTQASGYRTVAGAGRADGSFTIENVTDGLPYLLKIGTSYYATTNHAPELRNDIAARGAPPPARLSAATAVSFNVQGMSSFLAGPEGTVSSIEVTSPALGYRGVAPSPAHSARAFVATYDWESGSSRLPGALPLPDAAQSDDLVLVHRRNDVIQTATGRRQRVNRAIDTFSPSAITVRNGETTTVNGNWAATGPTRSINLQVSRGMFDGGYDAGSRFNTMAVSLLAHPARDHQYLSGPSVFDANLVDWSRSGALNETLGFMYRDPYPTAWPRALNVSYFRTRSYRLPGTANTFNAGASNIHIASYTSGDPSTAPPLQPPANVRVAGRDASAGGLVAFDGTAPLELTWSAVATAKVYSVAVLRLVQNGSQTQGTNVAIFTTAQTSIKLPAEVFSGSQFFAFLVTAGRSPSDYENGQLHMNGLPYSAASIATGQFRLSDRCGNSTMDSGEQCDAGGESATCDIDCTTNVCGDGIRNAAAGEACDSVGATAACDIDCTLPACGDNRVNPAIEDCDDGNPADTGNGCSAACKYNNICGDGTVQNIIEACDPGTVGQDSATCDSDCTARACGDGHHNAAAGEQCDDGNTANGDGCSSTCTLQ